MRAAWYRNFGPADRVLEQGEHPRPSARPGEVLVRVAASGVNPVDVKRRAGGRGEMTAERVIPHFDGAGVIEQLGAGVSERRTGERVWLHEVQWQRDWGTAAEFVAIPYQLANRLPESTSFIEGACLGIPALTAHRCVFGDGPVDGRTVLVTGGAGAVGHYAVQFARIAGARVLATASTAEKAKLAKAAGAEHVVNYREQDVAERVLELTDGKGVDRVVEVEFGGNLATSVAVLKRNGVIATYASEADREPKIPFYSLLYKCAAVRFEVVFLMPADAKRHAIEDITQWLDAGRLSHHVAQVFDLQDIAAAHTAVEQGAFGKVVLTTDKNL